LEKLAISRLKSSRFELEFEHELKKLEKTEASAISQLNELIDSLHTLLDSTNPIQVSLIEDGGLLQQYKDLFSHGKSCPYCQARQAWYPVDGLREWKQRGAVKSLESTWGEPKVELLGMPDASEYVVEETKPEAFAVRYINKPGVALQELAYWHLRRVEHDNILLTLDVMQRDEGEFSVIEEKFEGVPLSTLLEDGISEKDFQDIILQLCDALELLHTHKPRISHNAISTDNVLIGEGNLLKLTNFTEAEVGKSAAWDIALVGELMLRIDVNRIAGYGEIIEKCITGEYKKITDLRKNFLPYANQHMTKLVFVIGVILMALFIFARRIL